MNQRECRVRSKVEESDEHWDEVDDNDGEVVVGRVGSYVTIGRQK